MFLETWLISLQNVKSTLIQTNGRLLWVTTSLLKLPMLSYLSLTRVPPHLVLLLLPSLLMIRRAAQGNSLTRASSPPITLVTKGDSLLTPQLHSCPMARCTAVARITTVAAVILEIFTALKTIADWHGTGRCVLVVVIQLFSHHWLYYWAYRDFQKQKYNKMQIKCLV